jgi:hypothetical protein
MVWSPLGGYNAELAHALGNYISVVTMLSGHAVACLSLVRGWPWWIAAPVHRNALAGEVVDMGEHHGGGVMVMENTDQWQGCNGWRKKLARVGRGQGGPCNSGKDRGSRFIFR